MIILAVFGMMIGFVVGYGVTKDAGGAAFVGCFTAIGFVVGYAILNRRK